MSKQKSIELSNKKIKFELDREFYKIIRFYPDKMSLDIMVFQRDGSKSGIKNIPFAHLPKKIKQIIKPN